jgi:DNA (cytosine-5)-methyltransferase 1
MRACWPDREHLALIEPVRHALVRCDRPYVIENVEGARRELISPVMLCGTMFGLGTQSGAQLRRHRYFECSFPTELPPRCIHNRSNIIGVYGGGQHPQRRSVIT